MLFHIDPGSGVPIFRQLMDQVKLSIASGALKSGDELPSIRSLCVPLGVNPMTISKAYNLLVHDGVLERRPGLPLIVAAIDDDDLSDRRAEQVALALAEPARLVRSLEFDRDQALDLFRELLKKPSDGEEN